MAAEDAEDAEADPRPRTGLGMASPLRECVSSDETNRRAVDRLHA